MAIRWTRNANGTGTTTTEAARVQPVASAPLISYGLREGASKRSRVSIGVRQPSALDRLLAGEDVTTPCLCPDGRPCVCESDSTDLLD